MVLPRDIEVVEPPPQHLRRTAPRRFRDSRDCIIVAHKHYFLDRPMSNCETAGLFAMARQTIDDIVRRIPKTHPGVRDAAVRFRLLAPPSFEGMPELDLLEIEGMPFSPPSHNVRRAGRQT